ncbi:MAG TPA: PilN domain-containing protein [Gaiellaceae bacterium]|nr:PilN domain-containing protein [Gaiellaceae bacterium]
MPIDLKKEIKLSDVFKRREKDSGEPEPTAAAPPPPRENRNSKPAPPQVPLMRAFNLVPRDDARQPKRGRPTAQIALALVAVLLFGALGSLFLVSSASVTEKKAKRDDLRVQVGALDVPAKAPGEQEAPELASEQQARTTELAAALRSRVAWDRLLRNFALVLPEDVWLTSLAAKGAPGAAAAAPAPSAPDASAGSAQADSFTINGYTHEQAGVARLLARLSVLPELASVSLVSSTRVEVNEREVVQFSISAAVKQAQGGTT